MSCRIHACFIRFFVLFTGLLKLPGGSAAKWYSPISGNPRGHEGPCWWRASQLEASMGYCMQSFLLHNSHCSSWGTWENPSWSTWQCSSTSFRSASWTIWYICSGLALAINGFILGCKYVDTLYCLYSIPHLHAQRMTFVYFRIFLIYFSIYVCHM